MSATYSTLMKETYPRRASTYDLSTGGYHIDLAQDFVEMLRPQPGDRVLDVASGTGLVAIDIAARVGASGRVVAVDWSLEMQAIGKAKVSSRNTSGEVDQSANIDWVLADITSEDLLNEKHVREIVEDHGGFDIITMCQGYMQLPDLQGAICFWSEKLLRPGGRMISDMTTEDPTLQYLMTYHLPLALSPSAHLSSGRVHITGQQSFENLFVDAGLEIEEIVRTKLYGPEYWFEADEETSLKVLQQEIDRNLPWTPKKEDLQHAMDVWPQIWESAATKRSDGKRGIEGRHPFYICIGRKPC